MPRVVEGLHRLRVFIDPVPHHEEGGFYLVAVQDVDELLGVLVAPGRVEADGGQLLVPLDAVDGQLPLGSRGVHGGGVVDHIKHQADSGGASSQRQGPSADQECFHGNSPPKQYALISTNICPRRAGHTPPAPGKHRRPEAMLPGAASLRFNGMRSSISALSGKSPRPGPRSRSGPAGPPR